MAYVCTLPKFFTYLADTKDRLDAPEHLDSRHIDGFEACLEAKGKSRTNVFTQLIKVVAALREVAAEGAVQLSAGLRDRLAYTSARPMPRSCPRDAYSPISHASFAMLRGTISRGSFNAFVLPRRSSMLPIWISLRQLTRPSGPRVYFIIKHRNTGLYLSLAVAVNSPPRISTIAFTNNII
jgi:hypothetical protein